MSDEDIMDLIDTMIYSGVATVNKKSLFKLFIKGIYKQGKEDSKKEIAEKLLKELEE